MRPDDGFDGHGDAGTEATALGDARTPSGGPEECPASRWQLTAPESYVLLHGRQASGLEALKFALMELVARRALLLEPVQTMEFLGRREKRSLLREGPKLPAIADPSLLPVVELYGRVKKPRLRTATAEAPGETIEGVLVKDFAPAALKAFSDRLRMHPFERYLDRHVIPSLIQRGLVGVETHHRGGSSHRQKFRTPAGVRAWSDLNEWVSVGNEHLGEWVSGDPSRALAYVATAGAAVLLVTNRYPELGLLGRQLRERALSSPSASGGSSDGGHQASEELVDSGALDLSALEVDFSALDRINSA